LAFIVGGGAGAAVQAPPLVIGSAAISDGTAVVAGAVTDASASLQVNGQPVTISQSGEFQATVAVGGAANLVVRLGGSRGESVVVRIPVAVALQTNGRGILDHLLGAGIRLDVPADGFVVVDGQMPRIEGRVLNESELAALQVNGVDALGKLEPDGSFSIALGEASARRNDVTVAAKDENGVSQTSRFTTTRITTTIKTAAGTSVSSSGARGVVIANVKLDTDRLEASRLLGVLVTIKDKRGYVIRGASVRLRATPAQLLGNGSTRAAFTNRVGKARFAYRLSPKGLSGATPQTLAIATRASTLTAHAKLLVTVRLPAGAATG
jgi:hypothetical protein